jgi:hypothetical protein
VVLRRQIGVVSTPSNAPPVVSGQKLADTRMAIARRTLTRALGTARRRAA